MAVQILGRRPHHPADVRLRELLALTPDRITPAVVASLDRADGPALTGFGVRLAVLAMRERSPDGLPDGLLAMTLGESIDTGDDCDFMRRLALAHVAAAQRGAPPAGLFESTAARFDEG